MVVCTTGPFVLSVLYRTVFVSFAEPSRKGTVMQATRSTKPSAVIFDMDGTLCDVRSIRHLVDQDAGARMFDAFHEASAGCPPNHAVVDIARSAVALGYAVLVVTARKQRWERLTAFWLADHRVPSDALYCRHDFDNRPDYEVKKDILGRIRQRYEVVLAVDDNPNVLALWRESAVPCVEVPGYGDRSADPIPVENPLVGIASDAQLVNDRGMAC